MEQPDPVPAGYFKSMSVRASDAYNHPGFRKYFKNTGWIFFAKIFSMGVSLLSTIYIARVLGPGSYGELSYATSFVSIFSFIAVLGIDQVLYRDLINHPDKKNQYMGSAFAIRLAASAVAILLCIGSAVFFSPKDVSLYLICILSVSFVFNSFQIINFEFQANSDSKYPSVLTIYISIILNVLKIVAIALNKGVLYLALILVLESILYAGSYLYYRMKVYGSILAWKYDKAVARSILHSSWPLIFSSAFALIYARIDQIMIKNLMSAESVGLYDVAVRLSEVWYFIPAIIISSLLPPILNAKKISEALYYSRIRRILGIVLVVSFTTSLVTYIFAPELVNLIFGDKYSSAIILLQIYVWSNIATALNGFMSQYLLIEHRTKTIFMSSFIGMSLNVALNIFLIPKYGTAGAAFATLISYTSVFLFIFTVPESKYIFSSPKIQAKS